MARDHRVDLSSFAGVWPSVDAPNPVTPTVAHSGAGCAGDLLSTPTAVQSGGGDASAWQQSPPTPIALHHIQIPHVQMYRPRSRRCSRAPVGALRRARQRERRPAGQRRRIARTTSGTDPPGGSDDDLVDAAPSRRAA
jgi:hypothetical protein